MTEHIWNLMKKRDHLLKKAFKSGIDTDMRLFKDCRNKVVNELRKAKAHFFIKQAKGNNHLLWKHINKLSRKENKSIKSFEMKINNILTQDVNEIAMSFNMFFKDSVYALVNQFGSRKISIISPDVTYPVFSLKEVCEQEVMDILKGLKDSRAQDIYGMDSCLIKRNAVTLCSSVTQLINKSFGQAVFPESLKAAVITPIFKGGDHSEFNNYRPVSILPIISKVIEKFVTNQLINHLNLGYHSLNEMQFGFRPKHSTETTLCYFVEQLKFMLDKGGVVGTIFIDLKKAFDTVNHNVLLSKLSTHNVSANAIEWMASYLHNRQHCTRIKGTSSSSLDCPTGVPQGSVLGPLLFSIYINDLPSICPEFRIQMYADDTVIYVHAKSKQHAASLLSGAMEKIADWMTYSCLILNYSKTVSMYFSIRGSSCTPPVISIKGQKVQQVKY